MLDTIPAHPSLTLPAGTLTFLLTDIEGSTRLWDFYPGQMKAVIARHDELIEGAAVKHSGILKKSRGEGDSRFLVFSRASDAVSAAAAIQSAFSSEIWGVPLPLKLRIALHTGEVDLREGDYYGSAVNRCARLRSAAHGGQVLITQTIHELVVDDLPPGISFRDMGEHKLKDLNRKEHIYQLDINGLPVDFPPIAVHEKPNNNLPASMTSFVGREREIEDVNSLLDGQQLLTITGAGGSGKTRLALQVARRQNGRFPDGTWMVDLTPLSNSELVTNYVMNSLGIQEEQCCAPIQTLKDALRKKSMLLILDNCEHILDGTGILTQNLMAEAIMLTILATSREPLGIPGETIWHIPPLSIPKNINNMHPDELLQFEAVKLFVDRALKVKTDFILTDSNATAVAEICLRLDGIPLAIELAAARVRVLPVEEIAARLDDRFHLLVGSQNVLPRQKTLQNLIDWSHDLLSEKERILFRRLSVFAGGWTLPGAEQVCEGDGLDRVEILDMMTHLLDKSLVVIDIESGGGRYRYLETIRQYARARMEESGEKQVYLLRHAEFFTEIAEQHYVDLWGPNQFSWLSCLDQENDNIREALEWMAVHPGTHEMMLRMAGSLWRFWRIRGYLSEGLSRLEYALEINPEASAALRANGLRGASKLALQQGDYAKARAKALESLELFKNLDDKLGIGRQQDVLGEIAQYHGEYLRAAEIHAENLNLRHEIGDKEGVAISLRQLGVIARDRGDYQEARGLLEKSLQLCRELDDKILIAQTLNFLGLIEHPLCEYERATMLFEEAVTLYRTLNDKMDMSNTLLNLGNVSKDRGEFTKAKSIYDECLHLKKELGDKRGTALTLANLAEVVFCQGNYLAADELAERSLSIFEEIRVKRGINHARTLLSISAVYRGDYRKARLLAESSLALSDEVNSPRAVAYSKLLLGLIDFAEGDLAGARDQLEKSLEIFRKFGDRRNVALTLVNLARTAYRQVDHQFARGCLQESLAISRQLNTLWVSSFGLEIMGLLLRSEGDYLQAHKYFLESLRISIDQENLQGIANCLGALAGLAAKNDLPVQAANLFAAADKLRQLIGARMAPNDQREYETQLNSLRLSMEDRAFSQAWTFGLGMTTDQIQEMAAELSQSQV